MKVNNKIREDDIKKENTEIDNVDHGYIGDEYKDIIKNIFKFSFSLIIENLV